MQPLGPLNGKSFLATISPWIVILEAMGAIPHRTTSTTSHAAGAPRRLHSEHVRSPAACRHHGPRRPARRRLQIEPKDYVLGVCAPARAADE